MKLTPATFASSRIRRAGRRRLSNWLGRHWLGRSYPTKVAGEFWNGLPAGGNRIRTIGPAAAKGSAGRCQSGRRHDQWNHLRSGPRSRGSTWGPSHGRSVRGGTDGSNPVPSTGESLVRPGHIGDGTYLRHG